MKTQTALYTAQAAVLGLLVSLAGCSGSSSSNSGSGGTMFIESCSLGCGNGSSGIPIGCSLVSISQNAEVTIQFSQPVALSSVTSGSFRLVNLNNGTVPTGVFTIDPLDARRLVFRPSLEFTGPGVPVFGFDPNETYQILILGEGQDPNGPFIRSVGGKSNTTRMSCTVQTTQPLIDPVPGSPTLTAWITSELHPITGAVQFDPITHDPVGGVPLDNASNQDTESRIVLIFDDIMNKATVANQMTGQSNTINVAIDPLITDPFPLVGTWAVDVDFDNLLRTTAIFTPNGGAFPPAGGDPMNPRLVTVDVTNQLLDIVGNSLENPGQSAFSTTIVAFEEEVLTEDFGTGDNEDVAASGGLWGSGRLTFGTGGGSGRLGELNISTGETLTLDTDSQAFPLANQVNSILSNVDPSTGGGGYDALDEATWPTVTIDQFGEAWEFSELNIASGGMLVVTGNRPARIFARGELVHAGVLDLTGGTPAAHISNLGGEHASNNADYASSAAGGLGADGGPAAGAGGQGADRQDMTLASGIVMLNVGGLTFPGAVNDGRPGGGVGGIPDGTGGKGGLHYPPTLPLNNNPTNSAYGDAEQSDVGTTENCRVAMVAGPGSGGSHALEGSVGQGVSPFFATFPNLLPNVPVATPGGDNSALDLEAPGSAPSPMNRRNLEFWRKHLRGGSGGGGGGTSIYGSRNNGSTGAQGCDNGNWTLFPFWDHSAAGGGGGGGAVMLVAGRRLSITGTVNCNGGDGGSATVPGASITLCTQGGNLVGPDPDCEKYAAPGGAGAGGSVRLQSTLIEIAGVPGRINVSGGLGGLGAGLSEGGDGSPGLVRIEYTGFVNEAADAAIYGPLISPSLPGDPDFNNPFTSAAILSIGEWGVQEFRPESYSGSQSCWMKPDGGQGNFFGLEFVGDDASLPVTDPARYGWNMDVIYDVPGVGERIYPYRGIPPNDPDDEYDEANFPGTDLGGMDFATFLGTTLNHDELTTSTGSLIAVRFQGIRSAGAIPDLCDLDVLSALVTPNSITPFVSHPDLLNLFNPAPNMIRFSVVFDEQLIRFETVVAPRIKGVTNFKIRVQPN